MTNKDYQYDVALSFAGDDRHIAEAFAEQFIKSGLSIFYDRHESSELIGKDLFQYLQYVYRDAALYCIIFVSKSYLQKLWTKHELKQAQERSFMESREYILPIKLDDTQLPGMNSTIGYIDLRDISIEKASSIIIDKIYKHFNFYTWHETPTNINEFSPTLKKATEGSMKSVVEHISSNVRSLSLSENDRIYLNMIAKQIGMDIEITIIDEKGFYVHHPWPILIGRKVDSQWLHKNGFADWLLSIFQKNGFGYLTWKDTYASDPEIEKTFRRRLGYNRRTLVAFKRINRGDNNFWYIAIEAHEIISLGVRQ